MKSMSTNIPLNSPNRPRNSFLSSSTLLRPFSINASNLTVNAFMRWRKSSKLKSTCGSCVSALSEYEGDLGPFCDARKEEVLVEKFGAAVVAAIRFSYLKIADEESVEWRRLWVDACC